MTGYTTQWRAHLSYSTTLLTMIGVVQVKVRVVPLPPPFEAHSCENMPPVEVVYPPSNPSIAAEGGYQRY